VIVLNAWGPCGACCNADLNADQDVGFEDVLVILNGWGMCPGVTGVADDLGSIDKCIERFGWSDLARLADCIEAMMLNGTP